MSASGGGGCGCCERDFPATDYPDQYRDAYEVKVPDPEPTRRIALVCAHMDAWQQVGCAAERAMDGIALLDHVDAEADRSPTGSPSPTRTRGASSRHCSTACGSGSPTSSTSRHRRRRLAAASGSSTSSAVSAPSGDSDADGGTDVVLRAPEYHHGNLDWYALEHSDDTQARPSRCRGAAGGADPQRPDLHPDTGRFRRDAQHALVGVRGSAHELRRGHSRYDRRRQVDADGVRPDLRERLVRGAVDTAGRRPGTGARHRGDDGVRRAAVDRARRPGCRRRRLGFVEHVLAHR